ncbi:MAG: SDR family NAD(P)-dependent oxidoreductase [Burkholderiaceae bacterium]
MEFSARVAFVTGAASGIGRATALAFAAAGARVALVDRDTSGCAQTLDVLQPSGILWLSSAGAASAIGSVLVIDAGFTAM